MSQSKWQTIDELFHAARALPAGEREAFVREKCGGDAELFADIMSLIASSEADHEFMEQPAVAAGARLIESDKWLGTRIGKYKTISELGRGGMGSVYLAYRDDDEFQQRVAIKIVRDHVSSPALFDRFRRERQILANLDHPNIARLLDGGTMDDGTPYFVMEYVVGANMVRYAGDQDLSVGERLTLFLKVCDAVGYAHGRGIIHRDIKPTNVLVTEQGEPKLLDFGIAKVLHDGGEATANTMTGFHLFTPEYSSPEQTRGESLSTATDIYSLGVLLYEMLTMRQPFDLTGRSPLDIARIVCETDPPSPSSVAGDTAKAGSRTSQNNIGEQRDRESSVDRNLNADLDNIVLMAMRKEPSRRYQTVEALAADIRRYLHKQPVAARPNSLLYLTSKFVNRNGKLTVAVAASLLLLFSLPAVYLISANARAGTRKDAARRLTYNDAADDFPRFMPDGRIVFSREDGDTYRLLSISPDGGDERLFAEQLNANRIYPSPDGKLLAFRSVADNRIYIADENKNVRQVTKYRAGRVAWSPDARRLLFSYNFSEDMTKTDPPFYRNRDNVEVFSVNADGSDETDLTNDPEFDSDASFSPDGRSIVFASERDGNFEIYTMNADGSNLRRLTKNGFDDTKPSWSPDGRHIAFTSTRDGDEEIYIMNTDGSDQRRLTYSLGDDREAQWSPDGKRIVFSSASDGNKEIFIIDIPAEILSPAN